MDVITHIVDAAQGKHPIGTARSGKWAGVRAAHLKLHPTCALCGGSEALEVHHRKPFHLHPELELDPENLITLCESKRDGVNCHLFCGHLGNFKSLNADVETDAAQWNVKLKARP